MGRQPHNEKNPSALSLDGAQGDEEVTRAYLTALLTLSQAHRRRRSVFKAREHAKDHTDRMFILGDDRPWTLFGRETPMQRRKWALETCGVLQWTALHASSRQGDLEAVKRALSTRTTRHPALSMACHVPDARTPAKVPCALRRDACGRVALHHAVVCERWPVVKWLLKRPDASVQLRATDFSHRTAVHYALEKLERVALRHPCRRAGEPVSLVAPLLRDHCPRYRRLWRNIDRMVSRMRHLDVQARREGAQQHPETTEEADFRCRGGVWDACRSGDAKRLAFLADVYYSGAAGARQLQAGAVLSELRWSLLHEACSHSHASIVLLLLTHQQLGCFRDASLLLLQDTSGSTALHHAARRQALDVCALLVDECAAWGESDRNDLASIGDVLALVQDTRGRTALHSCLTVTAAAVSSDSGGEFASRSAVATFLARKCPSALHVRDHDGMTPLHLAVWRGDVELVQRFLDLGADADAATSCASSHGTERCWNAKAPWAPCGLVFQQRKQAKAPLELQADEEKEMNTSECSHCAGSDQSLEDRRHDKYLFECPGIETSDEDTPAVYYWIGRMTARRCTTVRAYGKAASPASSPVSSTTRATSDVNSDDDALIGCEKYGGTCDWCQRVPSGKPLSDAAPAAGTRPLTPLIIALRACSRTVHTSLSDRVLIVDMLLQSGAHPDGGIDESGDSSGDLLESSPLLEAIRIGEPSIIYALLCQGATRIDFERLGRYMSSDWSVEGVESVLNPLAALSSAIERKAFASTLFTNKCFVALTQLVGVFPSAQVSSESSVWRTILHQLEESVSKREPRQCGMLVNKDHLEFLCRAAEGANLVTTSHRDCNTYNSTFLDDTPANNTNADGLEDLIKFCVRYCLHVWTRSGKVARNSQSTSGHDDEEAALTLCIPLLLHAELQENAILEQVIACGFFQAATTILGAQIESDKPIVCLDRIFCAYDKGVDRLDRVNTANPRRRHADDFLCVWVGKLLLQNRNTSAAPACNATVRSVVYACSHNLPLVLIERCLDVATSESCDDDDLEAMVEASQVGIKRLEHWLVLYRRLDVVHVFFRSVYRTARGAWMFWRRLMAASIAKLASLTMKLHEDEEAERSQQWISELVSLPSSLEEHMRSSSAEFELDTLEWLVIHRVVPTDCDQAMRMVLPRIQKLQGSTSAEARDANGASLRQWCIQTRLVYECARWNATRVYTCTLEAIRTELSDDDVGVWLSDVASRVDAIDGHSPVSIARVLGQLSMCRALSTASLPLVPTVHKHSHQEPSQDASLGTDRSPSDGSEKNNTYLLGESRATFGFLRAVLTAHELVGDIAATTSPASALSSTAPPPFTACGHRYFAAPSFSEDLEMGCRSNRVHHLAILTDLMSPSTVAANLGGPRLGQCVLTAVSNGALDAVRWLLSAYNATSLTEDDSHACVQLAARRMTGGASTIFVEMLVFLLDRSFAPGRLAGDGGDITILHYAACVGDPLLAQRVLTRIISIEGCDINALDPQGNTPVVYALASGRLENACFLMQHPNCRLEAEFEGQARFYYSLDLVPNLSARRVIKALLMSKRAHAFLHCEADSGACACKSFEAAATDGEDSRTVCSFCDHDSSLHNVVPLPSWFRDQYDTYIDGRRGNHRCEPEQSDEEGGCRDARYEEEGAGESHQAQQAQCGGAEIASDDDLENSRGRLDLQALESLSLIRYESIINTFDLQSALATLTSSVTAPEIEIENSADPEALCEDIAASAWPMIDLHLLDSADAELETTAGLDGDHEDTNDPLDQWVRTPSIDSTLQLPWSIRADANRLHPATCACQCLTFVTTPQALLYVAVARWLRLSCAKALNHNWMVTHAFSSWRFATASPLSEPIDRESPSSLVRTTAQSSSLRLSKRERMLQRAVVAHWRLGRRVLTAFQAWKQRSTSPELALHALEDAALGITSDMRRHRLDTLRVRQFQVQEAAHNIISFGP